MRFIHKGLFTKRETAPVLSDTSLYILKGATQDKNVHLEFGATVKHKHNVMLSKVKEAPKISIDEDNYPVLYHSFHIDK